MDFNERMLNTCKEWFGGIDNVKIERAYKQNYKGYCRHLYIASYVDEDNRLNVSLVRVFGDENSTKFNLSVDHEFCIENNTDELLAKLPLLINEAINVTD